MEVADGGAADRRVVAVDPAHDGLNFVTQALVLLDPLPAGARDLHQHRIPGVELTLVEELTVGPEPVQDALRVVEAIHPEQHHFWVAELAAQLTGAGLNVVPSGERFEARGVDGDGKRPGPELPGPGSVVSLGWQFDHGAAGGRTRQPSAGPQEVAGVIAALQADQIRAEQALDHLAAPRELRIDVVARKRYVIEESNPQVRPSGPEQGGNQLELIVLNPHHPLFPRLVCHRIRESAIDIPVRLPPAPLELRHRGQIVVQRPQGGVAKAFVVVSSPPPP